MLEGRWVKTMVLISPMRRATQAALQRRNAGQDVGAKEDAAQHGRFDAKRRWNQ